MTGRAKVKAYERLHDYLVCVQEIAQEIKYNSEPFSQERRTMLVVTGEIQSALDLTKAQMDAILKKVYNA